VATPGRTCACHQFASVFPLALTHHHLSDLRSRKSGAASATDLGSPFLTRVTLRDDRVESGRYPFTIPLVANGIDLRFTTPITFLVGENGSGKSTLLEALAWSAGFSGQGGNRSNAYSASDDGGTLGRALALQWRQKVTTGFFLRAETFFNFATYLEESGSSFRSYGSRPLHAQSHGEAFLALFNHRFEDGLYILDEPEAAVSPQRQLAFLKVLHQLTKTRIAQFVIATHSAMLLAFPGASVWSLDEGRIEAIDYTESEHYILTRDFLASPDRFFRHLFSDSED
jgi:predicted ATPase